MDKVSMRILIDRLTELSNKLYDDEIETAEASLEIDKIIDELFSWEKYLPLGSEK